MRFKVVVIGAVLALTLAALPAGAHHGGQTAGVYDHHSGAAVDSDGVEHSAVGDVRLWRSGDGVRARVHTHDLRRGGVYTIWLITIVPDGANGKPDVSVHNLGGVVVTDGAGHASVEGTVAVGDPSVKPPGADTADVNFGHLADPVNSIVRVEIAYHGRASQAGADLDAWQRDFWTGEDYVCGLFPGPGPDIFHCPIEQAAEFAPAS